MGEKAIYKPPTALLSYFKMRKLDLVQGKNALGARAKQAVLKTVRKHNLFLATPHTKRSAL